jgi:hypothetical protein
MPKRDCQIIAQRMGVPGYHKAARYSPEDRTYVRLEPEPTRAQRKALKRAERPLLPEEAVPSV